MGNKFNTNPLDSDFPGRVAESQQTTTLPNLNSKTQTFAQNEDATRKFEKAKYSSLFETPNYQPPAFFQTSKLVEDEKPTSRKIEKIGLPENVLMVLPYVPWGIGLVAGVLELLFVPANETKVRFHAAQGLAIHIAIIIVTALLGFVGIFSDFADVSNSFFQLVTTILLVIGGIRVWKGKPLHIEQVDDLTNWLEEKVRIKS
jgi:uncharacterized membrane protein